MVSTKMQDFTSVINTECKAINATRLVNSAVEDLEGVAQCVGLAPQTVNESHAGVIFDDVDNVMLMVN